jgi:hypothetical protein
MLRGFEKGEDNTFDLQTDFSEKAIELGYGVIKHKS